jgi:hypothetical protein
MKLALPLMFLFLPIITIAQAENLYPQNINLRNGKEQEWITSPQTVNYSSFNISFDRSQWKTLSMIQYDVNHDWKVTVNGKDIGNLVVDEQRMVTYFSIPDRLLKDKNNKLSIHAATASNSKISDDITISNVVLYNSPSDSLLAQGKINVTVTLRDSNTFLPSRITILNDHGAYQPVQAVEGDTLAIRSGVIYSGSGNFNFSIPAGTYKIYASRGFEYGVDSATITIKERDMVQHGFSLVHEVKPSGWKSIDTHVHTREYSGHGDATMTERILTIAGEGLDYAVITEHNKSIDISAKVKNMKMGKWFTPIRGDELTTSVGHFNLFPMKDSSVPLPGGITWKKIAALKKTRKVVILNHARDEHSAFRPADTMFTVAANEFPSNAMEVMNSGSQQTDPRQLYNDWLKLMSRGVFLTAVGSSDSHDVSRFIVGQSRTYVSADGDLFKNMIGHKTAVSFGLLTQLDIENDTTQKSMVSGKTWRNKKIPVIIKVLHPSWIRPATISIYADGKRIYFEAVKNGDDKTIFEKKIFIQRPARKTVFVAIAEGADPKVPWWPVAKPYQHTSPEINPIVLGISSPVTVN